MPSHDTVNYRWDRHTGLEPGTEVSIYSAMAAQAIAHGHHALGYPDPPQWSGTVDVTDLEDVFRVFDALEDDDAERLGVIGYYLPSLSVGDLVTFGGKTYQRDPDGWSEVDEQTIASIKQGGPYRQGVATTGTHPTSHDIAAM